MRRIGRASLHALLLVALCLAGAASAQEAAPAPGAVGPYVGDETRRGAPLDNDVPFPEGVAPRERPLVFTRPARAHRAHAAYGRRAAAGHRRHRTAKHPVHRRRRR
jgi:hypothetical protein